MDAGEHKLRVLLVSHSHPSHYPGETETYALELYEAMRASGSVEPTLLARVGFPSAQSFQQHLGTPFGLVGRDENQYQVFSEIADFDWLRLTLRNKDLFTTHLRDFLLTHRPDLIHVQSTVYLGLDFLSLAKKLLPGSPIVYSLHDYRPICHRDGVMVRTRDGQLCDHDSPRRCNECFPGVPPADFFLRKRFVEAHLEAVDLFLAPSDFVMERYVEWGIPSEKIRVSEFGRPESGPVEDAPRKERNRLGFLGELDRHSGITVLLEAMKMVAGEEPTGQAGGAASPELTVFGGNLRWQALSFQRQVRELLDSTSPAVTLVDRSEAADSASPISEVDWVVVPTLWEGPFLIVEDAFRHGKPVICSGIGSLKEKVTDGVNGIHFRRGDPLRLAAAIRLATESTVLWQRLHDGIPPVRSIEEDAESLIGTYKELKSERVGARV
jgi:glycosyltransferase involved in cell wall biosynthesis